MQNFTFTMSKDDLSKGIVTLPEKRAEFVKLVHKLLTSAMEYAIIEQDGSYLNGVLDALKGEMRRTAGEYMSGEGFPFVYKDGKLAFKLTRAKKILELLGVDVSNVKDTLNEQQATTLATGVRAVMVRTSWDDEVVKKKREARAQAQEEKSVEDKLAELRKAFKNLVKKAGEADVAMADIIDPVYQTRTVVEVRDKTPDNAHILSKEMGKIVNMLAPYGDTELAKVTAALAVMLGKMNLTVKAEQPSEQAA